MSPSLNVAQHWGSSIEAAREIRRLLKPGGLVALAVQPRSPGATEETADQIGQTLAEALIAAEFRSVKLERRAMKPVSTVCAFGIK